MPSQLLLGICRGSMLTILVNQRVHTFTATHIPLKPMGAETRDAKTLLFRTIDPNEETCLTTILNTRLLKLGIYQLFGILPVIKTKIKLEKKTLEEDCITLKGENFNEASEEIKKIS